METQEEAMGSKEYTQIIKGKRTKRPRQPSPLALTMASSSSSMAEGGGSGGGGGSVSDNSGGFDSSTTSRASSDEYTDSTEEEQDMANCLILLAQSSQNRKFSVPMIPTTNKAAGLYVYQCKTCNRCFPSFQALGGHRASHKKPKAIGETKKPLMLMQQEEEEDHFDHDNTALSLQIPSRALSTNTKPKVHECSVCGAEFSSGQALGGHMRRHRTNSTTQEVKKSRGILSLDLNLPAAPEYDRHESKFPFASKEQVIVFSASSLVDCHY